MRVFLITVLLLVAWYVKTTFDTLFIPVHTRETKTEQSKQSKSLFIIQPSPE